MEESVAVSSEEAQAQSGEQVQEYPIWVQDLLAWLEAIKNRNLSEEQRVQQIQEVLAELPGRDLPDNIWAEAATFVPEKSEVLSDENRTEIQKELEAALQLKHKYCPVKEAKLPPTERLQQNSQVTQESNHEHDYYKALISVAAKLPSTEPELLKEVLCATQQIENEQYRSQALAFVATNFSPNELELLKEFLYTAQQIENEQYCKQALAPVTTKLPCNERQLVLKKCEQAAQQIENEKLKPLQEALQAAAQQIKNEEYCAQVLAAVAAQLPPSEPNLLKKVLDIAQQIKNEEYRAQVLAAVAAQLPPSEPNLLKKVLDIAQQIKNKEYRAQALVSVAAQLPPIERQAVVDQALAVAERLESVCSRAQVYAAVAAQLPPAKQQDAIRKALDITKLLSI